MRLLLVVAAVLAAACTRVVAISREGLADKIVNLPGVPSQPNFDQYAGYLDVASEHNASSYRHIFYWFTEVSLSSTSTSSTHDDVYSKPLIFWTNGGPGCSGLIGFFEEFGPFHPNPDGKTLYANPWAWNTQANVVHIEAPAGVGFSYSDDPNDYNVGDARTARDNLHVILAFLQKFPEFAQYNTPIYIASESYGGHYGPTWALEVLKYNQKQANKQQATINFRGFLIGNPYTNPSENIIGEYGTLAGHALVPSSLWPTIEKACLPSTGNPSAACNTALNQANDITQGLDPYSLDTPVCLSNGVMAQRRALLDFIRRGAPQVARRPLFTPSRHPAKSNAATPSLPAYDPCVENYETTYLNREDVQSAIHARLVASKQWGACSNVINYNETDSNAPMQGLYLEILKLTPTTIVDAETTTYQNDYIIFSGDDDSVCGTLGTQSWIFDLGLSEISAWSPWSINSQVAGFVTKLDGLSLVTVHTAGHEVAMFQPQRAWELLKRFLAGEWN